MPALLVAEDKVCPIRFCEWLPSNGARSWPINSGSVIEERLLTAPRAASCLPNIVGMPSLPEDARNLLRSLPLPPGLTSDYLEVRVAKEGVRAAIPYVSWLLPGRRREVNEPAEQLLSLLLPSLRPSELPALDDQMRGYGPWWASWDRIEPAYVLRLKPRASRWASLAVLSMHRSGYVREAALRQMAESKDGSELPYIFIRLNDWVAEIRGLAESAIAERLTPKSAPGLVQLLPLIGLLGRWSRAPDDMESRITDVLATPESRPAMLSGLRSDDVGVRRRVARLLIEGGGESLHSILQTALQDKDVVVRTWAAVAARQVLDGQELREALDEIGRNRSARVRQEALIGWVTRFPEESHDRLVTALLDRLATVRGFAQFELRRRGFDVVAFYRGRIPNLQSPEPIVGLGEVGSPEDTNAVEPYLRAADERIRIAAVYAIDHLGGDKRASLLVSALRDPAPAVSKAARRVLVRKPQSVDFLAVLSIFQEDGRSSVRRNSFHVLTAASKWAWLRYSLIAASDADPDIRADGLGQIDLWKLAWNRSFVEPTAQDLTEIRSAVNSLDDELRANVLDRIGFYLGSVKPPIT